MANVKRTELEEAELDIPVFLRHGRAPRQLETGPCRCNDRQPYRPWAWDLSGSLHTTLPPEGFNCTKRTLWRHRGEYLERYYLLESRSACPARPRFQLNVGLEFPELQLPERRWDPFHLWPWIRPACRVIPSLPFRWEWPLREDERFRSELIAAIRALSEVLPSRVEVIRSRFLARFPR